MGGGVGPHSLFCCCLAIKPMTQKCDDNKCGKPPPPPPPKHRTSCNIHLPDDDDADDDEGYTIMNDDSDADE